MVNINVIELNLICFFHRWGCRGRRRGPEVGYPQLNEFGWGTQEDRRSQEADASQQVQTQSTESFMLPYTQQPYSHGRPRPCGVEISFGSFVCVLLFCDLLSIALKLTLAQTFYYSKHQITWLSGTTDHQKIVSSVPQNPTAIFGQESREQCSHTTQSWVPVNTCMWRKADNTIIWVCYAALWCRICSHLKIYDSLFHMSLVISFAKLGES